MSQRAIALLIVALPLFAGSRGSAVTTLTATLTNDQEVPAADPTTQLGDPRPASFGDATLVLSDDQLSLTFTATVFNIDFTGTQTADPNDNLSVAHIHAGAAVTPTTNGPVVWGFIGAPFNDNNPNDSVVTPFAMGVGGTISGKWDAPEGNNTTLADQIANLLGGRAYVNFHTTQFPGGEVRGAIVPEPSTALLLSLGIAGLAGLRRRGGAA